MSSLAEELSRLTNTAPTWADPEDITDGAKLLESTKSAEDEEAALEVPSNLRKRAAHFLDEEDERYHGKKVSRKKVGQGNVKEEEDEQGIPQGASDEDEDAEESDDESFDEDQLQESYLEQSGQLSEEEDGSSEDDSDDDGEEESDGEGHTSFVDFNNSQVESEESDDEQTNVKKLTTTPAELQKGKAVRNQLSLWESLLKMRIELQKATSRANQLPQPDDLQSFTSIGGQEYTEAMKQAKSSLYKVLEQLVHLQTFLLAQNKSTASLTSSKSGTSQKKEKQTSVEDEDDEEIASDSEAEDDKMQPEQVPLKQIKRSQYPGFVTQRHNAFTKFRDDTIQKWYDKTRVSSGKLAKGFSAFDQSALKQIQQILTDRDRLLKRTQLKRSNYKVLGKRVEKAVPVEEAESEETLPRRDHLKEYDEEIFDDDDFYHQVLRELIESKSRDINDPVAITRHWLEIQKLRKKAKKVVDTRASKGRKIRYEVHPKMVNFMASLETSTWTDEAKNELYSSLFGKQTKM